MFTTMEDSPASPAYTERSEPASPAYTERSELNQASRLQKIRERCLGVATVHGEANQRNFTKKYCNSECAPKVDDQVQPMSNVEEAIAMLPLFVSELKDLRTNVERELIDGLRTELPSIVRESVLIALQTVHGIEFAVENDHRAIAVGNATEKPETGDYAFGTPVAPRAEGIPSRQETYNSNSEDEMLTPPPTPMQGANVLFNMEMSSATPVPPGALDEGSNSDEGKSTGKRGRSLEGVLPSPSIRKTVSENMVGHRSSAVVAAISMTSETIRRRAGVMGSGNNGAWMVALRRHRKADRITKLVRSDFFDYIMGFILIINSIVIGVRADWEASNLNQAEPLIYIWGDRAFCVIFLTELLCRLWAFGLQFYFGSDWQWAYFDTAIVTFQVIEELFILGLGSGSLNVGFLKILKMGRLLRMVRMVRLFPELKSLVVLILASMSSFLWTCVLLFLLVYVLSVYMVMMAVEVLERASYMSERRLLVRKYWGSIGNAILSLYWSITGGQDWADVIGPLIEETGTQIHNVIFLMYIAFATMVLMNLVTGVFVEGAQRLSREDKDRELTRMARKIFQLFDDDDSLEISKQEFEAHVKDGDLDEYLVSAGLSEAGAIDLFDYLDHDGDMTISVNEFVDGCIRLRGQPNLLSITQLLMEQRIQHKEVKESMKRRHEALVRRIDTVQDEPRHSRGPKKFRRSTTAGTSSSGAGLDLS